MASELPEGRAKLQPRADRAVCMDTVSLRRHRESHWWRRLEPPDQARMVSRSRAQNRVDRKRDDGSPWRVDGRRRID